MSAGQPHAGLAALRAEFPYGIAVSRVGLNTVGAGVATCLVQRSTEPGQPYLVSCRHVLSLSLVEAASPLDALRVSAVGDETRALGQPTHIRGPLVGGMAPDFDAQLARLHQAADGPKVMRGLSFDRTPSHVRGVADLQAQPGFWVATGRPGTDGGRHMVWVDYRHFTTDFTMAYTLAPGVTRLITHTLVLVGSSHDTLGPGDSGSPAVLTQRGGRLIGMYIGGDGTTAYVIPAWQLLNPRNYGVASGETWTLG